MAATVVNGACGAHRRSWVAAGIVGVSEAQILNQGRERHDVCDCNLYSVDLRERKIEIDVVEKVDYCCSEL